MHALQFREPILYRYVDYLRALEDFDFAQVDFERRKFLKANLQFVHGRGKRLCLALRLENSISGRGGRMVTCALARDSGAKS